jgi:uncharacterized protein (TIGR02271 family)
MNRDDRYDTGTMESIDTSNLMPLSRMSDFKVADNDQDVRGWKVIARDGDTIGKVDDLLIDTNARRVRYLGVDLDRNLLSGRSHSGHVLIPIESVRLDRHDRVLLDSVGSSEIFTLPTYDASMFGANALHERHATGNRLDTEREARLTLSEEELAVGKQRVASGAVEVGKRVETQHVRESVPVTREEVTIERRPATGMSTAPTIEEGEVRVPLSHEEVVVEKRVVPKEELVIKKHEVQGEQVVEDEVRRERVEVNRTGDVNLREDKKPRR